MKKESIRHICQSLQILMPFHCLWGSRVWNMSLGSLGTARLSLGKETGCGIVVAQYIHPPVAPIRKWTRSYIEALRNGWFIRWLPNPGFSKPSARKPSYLSAILRAEVHVFVVFWILRVVKYLFTL